MIAAIEEKEGKEKLKEILSDDSKENAVFQENEYNPEELIFLANCEMEQMEYVRSIQPTFNYFLEISRIILDSLRQNSKMLDFYNSTAIKVFDICARYNIKREYNRISETIHSHFN